MASSTSKTAPALNMTIFATDSGWDGRPLTTAAWVSVDVADVNEAPRLHDGSSFIELDVPRDLPKGSTLDILSTRVVDEDLPKQSLAYALVGSFQLRDASAMEWYESPLPWLRLDELQGTLVLNTRPHTATQNAALETLWSAARSSAATSSRAETRYVRHCA